MTKINLSSSLLIISLLFASCSNKEQEESAARQARQEQQDAADRQHQAEVDRIKEENTPAAKPEPEQPAEPQYEEVRHYFFTSSTERNPVECTEEPETQPCGVTYKYCKNDLGYYCQVGVKSWSKVEKELVSQPEN